MDNPCDIGADGILPDGWTAGWSDSESDDMLVMLDGEGRVFGSGDGMSYSFTVADGFVPLPPPEPDGAGQATFDDLVREAIIVDRATGNTKWLGADAMETPRCALEEIAAAVFKHHTKDCEDFDPETSGVEFWVQSRGSRQSIPLHWDKDEELRISHGLYVHPHLSTVTYLTKGAPTVVFDGLTVPTIARHGNGTPAGLSPSPECTKVYVSYPKPGKHIAFDGRLLHGVLHDLLPQSFPPGIIPVGSSKDDALRVTFLANIWLNHKPKDVTPLHHELVGLLIRRVKPRGSFPATPDWKPGEVTKKTATTGGDDLLDFGCFGWNGDDFRLSSKLSKSLLADSGSGTLLVECPGMRVVENDQSDCEQEGAKRQRVE